MHRVLTRLFPVLAVALFGGLVLVQEGRAEEGTPEEKAPAKADPGKLDSGKAAPAEEKAPERVLKPFLWIIPGEVPSYLFGTAHSTDPRITGMHPASRAAFDKADAAYFEIDMIKDGPAQMAAMKLPEGKKTEDIIPAELLKRLDARLKKINPMLDRSLFGDIKPFAWVIAVPTLYEQMKKPGTPMLDAMLFGEAMRGGKTVGGLEKPAEQTAFLDTVTDEEALLMIGLMLDQWDEGEKAGKGPMDDLVNHYLRGNAKGLHDLAMDSMAGEKVPKELADRMMKGLSYERNERMAKAIDELLKANPKKSHFFAVGAMHLIGKLSVQHYLEGLGIKSKRVETPEKPATTTAGEKSPAKKAPEKKLPEPVRAGGDD